MARLNEILVGRFNRSLQKLFGIKGGPPVATVAPEIMPVFPLYNGVENRYLDSWGEFGAVGGVAAVAAQAAGIRIRNPANSNVVVVIEKWQVFESVADVLLVMDYGAVTADLTTIDVSFRLDRRGPPAATAVLSHQTVAPALTTQVFQFPMNVANTSFELILFEDQEIPLLPGDGVQIRTSAVNTLFQYGIRWRERFLEESERT